METELDAIKEEIENTWYYVLELQNQSDAYKVLHRMVLRLCHDSKLPSLVED